MKMAFLTLAVFGISISAPAQQQNPVELMCKQQAKDMAVQFYTACMDENQKAQMEQMEQLRADYKSELENIKKKFESKLAAVKSGETVMNKAEKSAKKNTAAASKGKKNSKKQAKGAAVTNKLPEKVTPAQEVLSINLQPEAAVVVPEQANVQDEVLPLEEANPYAGEADDVELPGVVQ